MKTEKTTFPVPVEITFDSETGSVVEWSMPTRETVEAAMAKWCEDEARRLVEIANGEMEHDGEEVACSPGEPISVWSIYDDVNMADVAFEGTGLVLVYSDYWPDGSIDTPDPRALGVRLVTDLPDDPTWTQLQDAAEKLIAVSGDHHHRFVEGFERIDDRTLRLMTGS